MRIPGAFRRLLLAAGVLALGPTTPPEFFPSPQKPADAVRCRQDAPLVRLADLPEASGIAASRRNPLRAWVHNDSGDPALVMIDERGAVTGRVQIGGATLEDWEALAVGPCPSGSCLYLADIGDNDEKRKRISVYRIPEPQEASGTLEVRDVFHATYPDGSHDAETLLVSSQGEMYVVTKGERGAASVYQFPRDVQPGAVSVLTRVGKPRDAGRSEADDRITDGAVSPNGAWVVLRSNRALFVYAMADLLAGNWRQAASADLRQVGEPQGEGVTFADATTLYLVGEGGGKGQPGTFVRMTCTF